MFVAIDKLDEIGESGVSAELLERGFDQSQVAQVFRILNVTGTFEQKIEQLDQQVGILPEYERSRADLEEVHKLLTASGFKQFDRLEFDPTLARGLS